MGLSILWGSQCYENLNDMGLAPVGKVSKPVENPTHSISSCTPLPSSVLFRQHSTAQQLSMLRRPSKGSMAHAVHGRVLTCR
eukprot:1109630-Pelagomonas_calceolata.AAC.5